MATLMGAMTIVAVGLAVMFALPGWIGSFVALVLAVAWVAFLAAGAFYAKSTARTFCIGAIAAHWLAQTHFTNYALQRTFPQLNGFLAEFLGTVGVILADAFAGWVCVRARRYWELRDQ